MLDERGGISPFGWAAACAGRRPDQVGEDVRALVEWSTREWKRHFPQEYGYQVCVDAPADTAQGVRLTAIRGDFRAEATVERGQDAHGAATARVTHRSVRSYGNARSDSMHSAHLWGERVIQRCRIVGWAVGTTMFLSLAWTMIGERDPIYVLGGMVLVIGLLLMLTAGGTLGTCLGEWLATIHRNGALTLVHRNVGLPDDIRRWKAVSRKMLAQRSAFAGRRGQPFRREPSPLARS